LTWHQELENMSKLRYLLEFFTDENRILLFRRPQHEEQIPENDREIILNKLASIDFIDTVEVNLAFSEDSLETIKKLASNLLTKIHDKILEFYENLKTQAKFISNEASLEDNSLDLMRKMMDFMEDCLGSFIKGEIHNKPFGISQGIEMNEKEFEAKSLFDLVQECIMKIRYYLEILKFEILPDMFEISQTCKNVCLEFKQLIEFHEKKMENIKNKRANLEEFSLKFLSEIPFKISTVEKELKSLLNLIEESSLINEEEKTFEGLFKIILDISNNSLFRDCLNDNIQIIELILTQSKKNKTFKFLNFRKWQEIWDVKYESFKQIKIPLLRNRLAYFSHENRFDRFLDMIIKKDKRLARKYIEKRKMASEIDKMKQTFLEENNRNNEIKKKYKEINDDQAYAQDKEVVLRSEIENLTNVVNENQEKYQEEKNQIEDKNQRISNEITSKEIEINEIFRLIEIQKNKLKEMAEIKQKTIELEKDYISLNGSKWEFEKRDKELVFPQDLKLLRQKTNFLEQNKVNSIENMSEIEKLLSEVNNLREIENNVLGLNLKEAGFDQKQQYFMSEQGKSEELLNSLRQERFNLKNKIQQEEEVFKEKSSKLDKNIEINNNQSDSLETKKQNRLNELCYIEKVEKDINLKKNNVDDYKIKIDSHQKNSNQLLISINSIEIVDNVTLGKLSQDIEKMKNTKKFVENFVIQYKNLKNTLETKQKSLEKILNDQQKIDNSIKSYQESLGSYTWEQNNEGKKCIQVYQAKIQKIEEAQINTKIIVSNYSSGSFKKENNWINGKCQKCGQNSYSCCCKGNIKERYWVLGKCQRCGMNPYSCPCKGEIRESYWEYGKCQKCGLNPFSCPCKGLEKESYWVLGKCQKCGLNPFSCPCKGLSKEYYWNYGKCQRCGQNPFSCMCS